MKLLKRLIWFLLPILLLAGCAVRTVYVPHGTLVRLRETVKDVKVWVKDTDGQPVVVRLTAGRRGVIAGGIDPGHQQCGQACSRDNRLDIPRLQ